MSEVSLRNGLKQRPNYFTRIGRNRCQLRAKRAARRRRRVLATRRAVTREAFGCHRHDFRANFQLSSFISTSASGLSFASPLRNPKTVLRRNRAMDPSTFHPPVRFHCHVYYYSTGKLCGHVFSGENYCNLDRLTIELHSNFADLFQIRLLSEDNSCESFFLELANH